MTKYDVSIKKGKVYEKLEKFDNAISSYEEAIKIDPNRQEAWGYLAFLYLDQKKDVNKSFFYLKKFLEFDPEENFWRIMGDISLELNKKEIALFSYIKIFDRYETAGLAEKVITLAEQNIKPKNPLDKPLKISNDYLQRAKNIINLEGSKESFDIICQSLIETKKCVNCKKDIPIWEFSCPHCWEENPLPKRNFIVIHEIRQTASRRDEVILNYGGAYYLNAKWDGEGGRIYDKAVYEDILVFLENNSIIWNKKLNATIQYLNFIPDQDKILIVTQFTKDETVLNPLDKLTKRSRKEYKCDLCGKMILEGSSYWRGYKNYLNDVENPIMFEGVYKICENCRPIKDKPDFPVAHIIILNFNGDILMDYKVIWDFYGMFYGNVEVNFLTNNRISVILNSAFEYVFDSIKNKIIEHKEKINTI